VDELLKYTLNFYCGGVSEFGKTMDYVRKGRARRAGHRPLTLSWRRLPRPDGDEKPCRAAIQLFLQRDVGGMRRAGQLMFRCKICPDSIGDLADITVADVWPGGPAGQ